MQKKIIFTCTDINRIYNGDGFDKMAERLKTPKFIL